MPLDANAVQSLFLRLVEIADPQQRQQSLLQECGDDAELKHRLEALLDAHDRSGGFLDTRSTDAPGRENEAEYALQGSTHNFDEPAAPREMVAGKFKLLEQIGEGGMGTVWMAEQRTPVKRLVALKLIKPGMDSRNVLARFEAERQALALMDHPNIARVLEGGTTEQGRPYFVMELVKGVPITQYCDSRQLPVAARLELAIQVCSAVQHAHQKGIIHRDLKPSNILVTEHDGKPVPKVIDFGLAKALNATQVLTERTLHTAYGAVVGTPLYMAPEQVGINAMDVDTRSDVYSLGVLLYELLTGSTPLEKIRIKETAWAEVQRLIREEEPPRPSNRLSSSQALPSIAAQRGMEPAKLSRFLRGDLDWIVMKCLEKERSRRYESANQIADELRRFLTDEPVLAGPPTLLYRARKFLRRHRLVVLVASLFLLALLAGVVGTGLGMIAAQNARKQAEDNEARARDSAEKELAARKEAEEKKAHAESLADAMTRLADSEKAARSLIEVREKEARWHLYKARQFPLKEAWQEKDFGRLEMLLQEITPRAGEPDFRGWEWYFLQDLVRQSNPELKGPVPYLAIGDWSRQTGKIAILTSKNTIDIWDPNVQHVERTLPKYKKRNLQRVTFSPDGNQLACVSGQNVIIWDLPTAKVVCEFPVDFPWMNALTWAPDGERLALGYQSREAVLIYSARTGDLLRTIEMKTKSPTPIGIFALDWHPRDERIAIGFRYGHAGIYDLKTNKLNTSGVWSSDGTPTFAIRWSPDGAKLAAAQWPRGVVYDDKLKKLYELKQVGGGDHRINALHWSSDNRLLLTGGADQSVRVYSGVLQTRLERLHASAIKDVAWSPDGTKFVSFSDTSGPRISTYPRSPSHAIRVEAPEINNVWDVEWSPDGRWIGVSGLTACWIIDAEKMTLARKIPAQQCRELRWNLKTGDMATVHYGPPARVAFWKPADGEITAEWKLNDASSGGNQSLDIAPDGQWLASGNAQDPTEPFLWNMADQKPLPRPKEAGRVNCLAFSPDGRILATAGNDGLRLWEVPTLRILAERKTLKGQNAVAWSPDNSLLAAGMPDGTMHIYRSVDGERIHVARAHKSAITKLQWSPDSHRIATASSDGSIIVWDSATFDPVLTIPSPFGPATSRGLKGLSWSPDGRRLAGGFEGGPVFILGSADMPPLPKSVDHLAPSPR